jgi:hypothetical protein
MRIDRRRFLLIGAAGAAASVAGAARPTILGAVLEPSSLARPDLLALLGPERVREIGARYRVMVPAEADTDALLRAIAAARPPAPPDAGIQDAVRADFARGRTVVVHGWVLSATEARQCALFSLLPA